MNRTGSSVDTRFRVRAGEASLSEKFQAQNGKGAFYCVVSQLALCSPYSDLFFRLWRELHPATPAQLRLSLAA
jgi:hypothetical protein